MKEIVTFTEIAFRLHDTLRHVFEFPNIYCHVVFFIEKTAFLHLVPQCDVHETPLNKYNDTEITEVIDSNPTTCLTLSWKESHWMQISLPGIYVKRTFIVRIIGNLQCSPVNGLRVSTIDDCEDGICTNSQCIPINIITSDGMKECKYRCHSFSICNHIAVDIVGKHDIGPMGSICEIIY